MIGLSGGIGSGKSTVANVWRSLGAYIVDADQVARDVVAPDSPGLSALVDTFGRDLITEDGTLNRPLLAQRAFASAEETDRLNGLLRPLIAQRSLELLAAAPNPDLAVYDVPLLIEHKLEPMFDHIVMVLSSTEHRLERLTQQRGISEEDARARMAQQVTDEERCAVADHLITNDGTLEELREQATALWRYFESCCSA